MAPLEAEGLELLQVYPGTLLKVEEGQGSAILCAADDSPFLGAKSANNGASRVAGITQGGREGSGVKPLSSSGYTVVGPTVGSPSTPLCPDDDHDEYDFGEAATATAGEGSSADDDTDGFSELSDPGGTEVVFVREGVAVWPGANTERILGRLSLVKQCNVLFIAWLPYSRGVLQPDGTFRVTAAAVAGTTTTTTASTTTTTTGGRMAAIAASARLPHGNRCGGARQRRVFEGNGGEGPGGGAEGNGYQRDDADLNLAGTNDCSEAAVSAGANDRTLYAVHPIPLSEVKALRRRVPPLGLGCPSLVVVLTSGVTLPPLYFHQGGIKALIATLKQHVFLLQSASEPHTFLVNDTVDPLSRSLCALQLAEVLIGGPPPGASATFEPGRGIVGGPASVLVSAPAAAHPGASGAAATTTTTTWASPACASVPEPGLRPQYEGRLPGGDYTPYVPDGDGAALDGAGGPPPSRSWADPISDVASVAGLAAGFEAVDGVCGRDGVGVGVETQEEQLGELGSGAARGGGGAGGGTASAVSRHASSWAHGLVDTINRFVQNVRGTASGWIGALEELDDTDDGEYYDSCPEAAEMGTGHRGADEDEDEEGGSTPAAAPASLAQAPMAAAGVAGAGGPRYPSPGGPGVPAWGLSHTGYRHCRSVPSAGGEAPGRTRTATGAHTGTARGGLAELLHDFAHDSGHGKGGGTVEAHGVMEGGCGVLGAVGRCSAGAALESGRRQGDVAPAGSVSADAEVASTAVGDFEVLDGGGFRGEAAAHPPCRRRVRPPPLSAEEWAAMFDAEGRLVREAALRDRVCISGCAPELRREVWKHLLGMYPRGSTAAQRAETAQQWRADYRSLLQQWQSMVPEQEARCASWRANRTAVDKDVRRTDRGHPFFAGEGCSGLRALRNVLLTHVVYDRDLGYCQGMSDIAAPLLVVMRDEAEAFWAFACLMGRMGGNFHSDLQGMTRQLEVLKRLVQVLDPPLHAYLERRDCLSYYFAFRWLLILFKREFKFDDVLSLWEACWACRRTRHLHLYLAAAVLVQHRRVILSSELDFDGMLRLSIGLAGRLELQPLLETAEALVGYAGEVGRELTAGLP